MNVVAINDPRTPAQVDRYWDLQWRMRLAANPRVKAVNQEIDEWHRRIAVTHSRERHSRPVVKVVSLLLRRQAG